MYRTAKLLDPQGSIFGLTLFIFINDLPDVINFQLGINVDGIAIFFWFNNESDKLDKVSLESDIQSFVNLCNKWLVNFSTKTRLMSFNHLKKPLFLPSTWLMPTSGKENSLRRIGLIFSTDMKCNNFIESIASWTGRRKGHHETLDTPVCCGNSEALVKIYVCAWKRISLKSSPMMFRIENTLQINVIFHL